jgi:hypothetical protein
MQVSVKLGLALLAAAFSVGTPAQNETVLKNQSTYTSTVGDEAAGAQKIEVVRPPTPVGPVPIPYPNTPVPLPQPELRPVTPPPASGHVFTPAWPSKITGPTMPDKSGRARSPAKIDAITIKQK